MKYECEMLAMAEIVESMINVFLMLVLDKSRRSTGLVKRAERTGLGNLDTIEN